MMGEALSGLRKLPITSMCHDVMYVIDDLVQFWS